MGKVHFTPINQASGTTRRRFLATAAFTLAGGTALAGAAKYLGLDRKEIDDLRTYSKGRDLRTQETQWAEKVWPTVQTRVAKLYEAERKDNAELLARKITVKDRRVKIAYTNFIPPGKRGNDGDLGPSFHIVKRFDDRQDDGTVLRTYVNESWPVLIKRDVNLSEGSKSYGEVTLNIGILPAESFRMRVQAFPGDLHERGAENLFVTDLLQAVWAPNHGEVPYSVDMLPEFARQHLFRDQRQTQDGTRYNPRNQVFVPVSSPLRCASCHSSDAIFTQDIFLKDGEKKTNFGAITPDEEFSDQKKIEDQLGYRQLKAFLDAKVQDESATFAPSTANMILQALRETRKVELPFMVEAIKGANNIPWLEADRPTHGDDMDVGFRYKAKIWNGEKTEEREFTKAIAAHYQGDLLLHPKWYWTRDTLPLIP